jgi:hypothetical protein
MEKEMPGGLTGELEALVRQKLMQAGANRTMIQECLDPPFLTDTELESLTEWAVVEVRRLDYADIKLLKILPRMTSDITKNHLPLPAATAPDLHSLLRKPALTLPPNTPLRYHYKDHHSQT